MERREVIDLIGLVSLQVATRPLLSCVPNVYRGIERGSPVGRTIVRGLWLYFVNHSRPKTIEEVASQQHAVNVLRKALSAANVRFAHRGTLTVSCLICSSTVHLVPEKPLPFWLLRDNFLGMYI